MISVIIPTLNRCALLEATLLSLTKQTLSGKTFEILVIDNGSTDETENVVSKFQSSFDNIRYILEKNPGLHTGRHRGLKESIGDLLVFADDDIEAVPTWLEGIQESFADQDTGLVGGKNIPYYESTPPDWMERLWVNTPEGRYVTYFSLLDFGDVVREIDPHFVFGCNFSIRKSLLVQVKGFHPDGMPPSLLKYRGDGETYVATQVEKLGYKTVYNPKASVKHWVPASRMNLQYIIKRAYAEGITQSYIDTRKRMLNPKNENAPLTVAKSIKNKMKRLFTSSSEKQIHKSFQDGYAFHQSELKKDKELLAWVLKESYLP